MIYGTVALTFLCALLLAAALDFRAQTMVQKSRAEWLQTKLNEPDHRLAAARRDYAQRERQLLNQIQMLAQRIASLKLKATAGEPVVEDPNDTPFLTGEGHEPYTPELQSFLDKIEFEESREYAEEQVERHRAEGMFDEQILALLERGE